MQRGNVFFGILLIMLGVLALVTGVFNRGVFVLWPLFILLPGLAFELGYFLSGRASGLLVPGGILTTIGILFMFETLTNWHFSGYTWPVYPIAVAIGLFQLYLHTEKPAGLLIPVAILGGFGILAFIIILFGGVFSWLRVSFIVPAAFILLGLYIILINITKR